MFDFEGTLLDGETMEHIGRYAGQEAYMKEVTRAGMEGKICFEESLRARVEKIKHLTRDQILRAVDDISLMPNAKKTLERVKEDYAIAVVTGGLDFIVEHLVRKNGLYADVVFATGTVFGGQHIETVYPSN